MVSFTKAFISTILIVGGSFFIPGPAGAGDASMQAPFNVGEVIERVGHHPRVDGDRIVIQDKAYEAEFKEGKAVIKARQGKPGAEDVVIPVNGRPEVRDGRVVYSSWEGEVEFEGRSRGLRFSERRVLPFGDSLVGRYTGNAARLERNPSNPPKLALGESRWTPTGEFLLDTSVVYLPAILSQVYPSVAFDGTNYLVVWVAHLDIWDNAKIYGARVTPGGVVEDPAGIVIGTTGSYQWYPSVTFGGTNYLVVWRNGGYHDIYGARVTTGGVVLDPAGIAISMGTFSEHPAVAFDGTNFLVVWQDGRVSGDYNIYGARVTQGGIVLDPSGIAISTPADSQGLPSVAFNGTNYLAAWIDYRNGGSTDIYGARVTPGGVVLDTAGIAISDAPGDQSSPSVATNGSNYLVAWQDDRNVDWDIYATRVSPGGVVLDTAGIAISTAARHQQFPSVAFDGANYLVVWEDLLNGTADIYGSRVTTAGIVMDTAGFAISAVPTSDQRSPCVAFGGSNYLVGWFDGRNPSYCYIYGARVTPGGMVLDTSGIAISTEANHQELPSVAFDGTNYLAVWQEWHSKCSYDIYGARISPSGMVLDPAGVAICTTGYDQISPTVAFDGTNYLAVWQDQRSGSHYDIYGARVNLGGVVLDPAGLGISISTIANKANPSIAFDGANYLVAWSDGHIYGTRVTPGGVVLDTARIAIRRTRTSQDHPTIAFDGTNYLVAWDEFYDDRLPQHNIDAARVTPGGVVLDTPAIVIWYSISGTAAPSVAFDGTNYLVVWQNWGSGWDINGSRVTPGGVVLDPSGIPISRALNTQSFPALAFDGADYIVVWEDNRSGVAWDIYGAKVNPSGAVIDSFPVSLQPGDQFAPAIVHGNGSQLFITYSGFTDSINGHPVINQRIWGKFYPMSGMNQEEGIRSIGPRISLRVFPNPFREKAWVSVNVPGRLKVYDALGRLVREFSKEAAKPGPLVWDGTDEHGRRLPGGVYFLRYEHGTGCETRKAVLVR